MNESPQSPMTTYSVHFKAQYFNAPPLPDKTVRVPEGTLLSDAAVQAGIPLRNDCGGQGLCRKCAVRFLKSDNPKPDNNLSKDFNSEEVFACRLVVQEDTEVIVPEKSLSRNMQQLVIQEKNFISDILDKMLVKRNTKYGVALDIGTTTLAAGLYQLQTADGFAKLLATVSAANPQRQYGADVISRIQKVIENPESLTELQRLITEAVSGMLLELSRKSGVPAEQFEVLSVAGNTVMEYLFLGIDPSPLGYAPFEAPVKSFPVISKPLISKAQPAGSVNRLFQIETMPLFGGFVGGDIVADTLALGLADKQENSFLIDLGTNGELALFSNGKAFNHSIITAATAAGPCFEGGGITYGTLALPGAVSGVQLRDDGSVFVSTISSIPASGICGSGLVDAVSELRKFNLIDLSGKFNVSNNTKKDTLFADRWITFSGKPAFILVRKEESRQGENIVLTQSDVRQFQLASGAVRSGILLLLQRQGLTPDDIDTFYIAGGFGSFIRAESAQRAGILPRLLPLEKVRFCGNTSLAGAALVLFDPAYLSEGQRIAERAEHIGLESLPDFAEVFAENMRFEIF